MHIEAFDADPHLLPMCDLINRHVEAAIPGWTIPAQVILRHLSSNHHEPIIDPWVIERKTLCVMEEDRLLAAAHLLRYSGDDHIGDWYRNAGDVAWVFTNPDNTEAGAALLAAAREQMIAWGVQAVLVFDNGLPVPLLTGIPDCWPHITQLFIDAGFVPIHPRKEAVFGGWLRGVPTPDAAPVSNLTLRRIIQSTHTAFAGFIGDEKIGWCEIAADLTEAGEMPSMRGWAELSEMFVAEAWRNQGVGAWLVQHAVEWLRLAGCDRIAFSVDSEDEGRGAGRFYERFGWTAINRMEIGLGYTLPPKV